MSWIEDRITDYYKWLRERTKIRTDKTTGWSVMSTPFLGAYNDPLEIYLRKEGNNIEMSDDGATFDNLNLLGINLSRSQKRREWVEYILRNYGVTLEGNELRTIATVDNFPRKKHSLLCAMLEISEMEVLAQNNVATLFKEDVKNFFDKHDLVYTPQFITKGRTGIEFTFDFQFAGRKKETVVKSFNTLNKINVPNFLFTWQDIKPVREEQSGKEVSSLAIVNDIAVKLKPEYIEALKEYGCGYIPWSQKDSPETIELFKGLVA